MEADAPTSLPVQALGRRTVAHVAAASLVALGLLAVTATAVAAADPPDLPTSDVAAALLDVVVDAADGATEPVVEAVEPAMEPALEPLSPALEALEPLTQTLPTLPVAPVVPALPTDPVQQQPVVSDIALATGERPTLTRPAFVDLGVPRAARPAGPSSSKVTPEATATADPRASGTGHSVVDVAAALMAAPHDVALTLDAGTTLAAGMLSGFILAAWAAWAAIPAPMRLRPIGLRLAPPVPPG